MENENTPFRRKILGMYDKKEEEAQQDISRNNMVVIDKDRRGMPYYFVTVKPVRKYRTDRDFFKSLDRQLWREFEQSSLERERIRHAMHVIVEAALLVYKIIDTVDKYYKVVETQIGRIKTWLR